MIVDDFLLQLEHLPDPNLVLQLYLFKTLLHDVPLPQCVHTVRTLDGLFPLHGKLFGLAVLADFVAAFGV